MDRYDAVLIIGSTGSGKTPLGELLEQRGLWGRKCYHFDFGWILRNINKQNRRLLEFSLEDFRTVQDSIKTGKLLENKDFHIAEKIFHSFVKNRGIRPEDLVILNGLPRHRGQADDVNGILNIRRVVYLQCPPDVVLERIRLNTGGDRSDRVDDADEAVRKRMSIFNKRTYPLLDYYRKKGICVKPIKIGADSDSESVYAEI